MAGDQFAFGFRKIEWRAVALGQRGDKEKEKTNETPRGENIPMRQDAEAPAALRGDDFIC